MSVIRVGLFRVSEVICAVLIFLCGMQTHAHAQSTPEPITFEVATVKPVPVDDAHPFDPKHFGTHLNPDGSSYWSMTPVYLFTHAYGVELFQVDGPEWAKRDSFDIEARFPEGADKKDEPRMLQALLKDRFRLTFHIEKRQLDGYVLVVGKHGEKLRPSLPDPVRPEAYAPAKPGDNNVEGDAAQPKITKNPDGSSAVHLGKRGTQTVKFDQELGAMHYEVSKMTMEELAVKLRNCLGMGMHKVVDETETTGTYQLAWYCPLGVPRPPTGGDSDGALPPDPPDGSALTRSLDALGLKIEKRKMLQDVYVIDHVERPSEN